MLQRIQTVYLLIVALLTAATVFFPLAVFQIEGELYVLDVFGLCPLANPEALLYPAWGLFVLTAIISLLSIAAIVLFKKRMLQIRFCIFNAIIMLGFYVFFAFTVYQLKQQHEVALDSLKIALSFPLISLILDYLAIRSIGADEVLVRSLDRLR